MFLDKAMINKYCEYCHKVVPYDHDCPLRIKYHISDWEDEWEKYKKNKQEKGQKTNPFYFSKQWIDKREYIKQKCFGLDVYDFVINQKITYGLIVHHIIPFNHNERLKLSDSNLIFLSDSNHKLIHKKMGKNYSKTVKEVQNVLKEFEKMFKQGV